jgi:hypothetical protein
VVIDSGLEIWAKRVQQLLEAARGLTKGAMADSG